MSYAHAGARLRETGRRAVRSAPCPTIYAAAGPGNYLWRAFSLLRIGVRNGKTRKQDASKPLGCSRKLGFRESKNSRKPDFGNLTVLEKVASSGREKSQA